MFRNLGKLLFATAIVSLAEEGHAMEEDMPGVVRLDVGEMDQDEMDDRRRRL